MMCRSQTQLSTSCSSGKFSSNLRCLWRGGGLFHNHPSGDPTPSALDIDVTRRVASALRLVDITLHDHIIIGQGRYDSFRSRGLL